MGLSKDTLTTVIAHLFSIFISFLQSIILAQYLLPKGRGELAIIIFLPTFITSFTHFGLHWSVIYFLKKSEKDFDRVLNTSLLIFIFLSFFSSFLVILSGAILFEKFFKGFSYEILLVCATMAILKQFENFILSYLRGNNNIYISNLFKIFKAMLTFFLIIIAIYFFKPGVVSLSIIIIFADSIVILFFLYNSIKKIKFQIIPDLNLCKNMFIYGIKMFAFSILLTLNYRLDIGLIRYFRNYEEVGYYTISVSMAEILLNIPTIVSYVLFPYITGSKEEYQNKITSQMNRFAFLLLIFGGFLIGLFCYPLIKYFYGKDFLPSFPAVLILLPGIIAISIQQIVGSDLCGRGYPEIITKAGFVGFLINFLLNILLIPKYGINGAAFASTISYSTIGIIVLKYFYRKTNLQVKTLFLLNKDDINLFLKSFKNLIKIKK